MMTRRAFGRYLGSAAAAVTLSRLAAPLASVRAERSSLPASNVRWPLKISANGHYLVDQDDRPFIFMADTAWGFFQHATPEDIERYLDDRAAGGFTVVFAPLEFPGGEPGLTDEVYMVPFVGEMLRPNERYFERCATYVAAARQRGITMLIHPIWHQLWRKELRRLPADRVVDYGRYVARLLAGFDNILWSLGGDLRARPRDVEVARHLAGGLREIRPDILRTFHPAGDSRSAPLVHDEDWLDFNMYQVKDYTSAAQYRFAYEDYLLTPTRPTFCGEFAYEYYLDGQRWPPVSPLLVRRSAYWSMLAGAMGYTYGRRGVWHFHATPTYELEAPWHELLDSPGTRHMTELVRLLRRIDWHKLQPDLKERRFAVASVGAVMAITTAALASDGTFGVAYYPEEKSTTFDLRQITVGDAVQATWFDPTNGAFRVAPGSPFPKSIHTFRSPGENAFGDSDWVLLLEGS